jgi:c-di-GMP-binding flagellar brake protein YcgR
MISKLAERRRFPRIRLQVPMFIRGRDAHGEEYLDLAKTLDISATGAFLTMERSIRANDIVSLTIPAPPSSSTGLVPASTPPIQARVRRLQPTGDALLVGVEFLKPLG